MLIQHGIRVSSSDGENSSLTLLGKDNYVACSCKVEATLVVAELWDLVPRPVILAALKTTANTDNAKPASMLPSKNSRHTTKKILQQRAFSATQSQMHKCTTSDLSSKIPSRHGNDIQSIEIECADGTIDRFEVIMGEMPHVLSDTYPSGTSLRFTLTSSIR